MIINTNMASLNTIRQLGINEKNTQSSLAKLSSGLRINSAADDAAGLAISEKMRGQISGLNQASKNAQDGISLAGTAEGALNETTSILQRMRELAVQSSNDTATDSDRTAMQQETDQLASEITRISNTTEFNTKNLLAGGFNATFQIGANAGQHMSVAVGSMDAQSLGVAGFTTSGTINAACVGIKSVDMDRTVGTAMGNLTSQSFTVDGTGTKTTWTDAAGLTGMDITSGANSSKYNDYKLQIVQGTAGSTTAASVNGQTKTITLTLASDHGAAVTASEVNTAFTTAGIGDLTAGTVDSTAGGTAAHSAVSADSAGLGDDELKFTMNGEDVIVKNNASEVKFTSASNKGVTLVKDAAVTTAGGFSGTNSFAVTQASSSVAVLNSDGSIKTDAVASAGIDISTQSTADAAITVIDNAINKVSAERSKLGAVQNRLDHTINNLGTASQNITSAEANIRDVDMAAEMTNFQKNNILQQAAQAMLAQANQQPQGVLQLLR